MIGNSHPLGSLELVSLPIRFERFHRTGIAVRLLMCNRGCRVILIYRAYFILSSLALK